MRASGEAGLTPGIGGKPSLGAAAGVLGAGAAGTPAASALPWAGRRSATPTVRRSIISSCSMRLMNGTRVAESSMGSTASTVSAMRARGQREAAEMRPK